VAGCVRGGHDHGRDHVAGHGGRAGDVKLPEYFLGRRGGATDLKGFDSKATPGLVEAITAEIPSFPQQWMDDRTRTQAQVHLLRHRKPGLLAVHLVDLDAEQP
jgi:hypothetical protein